MSVKYSSQSIFFSYFLFYRPDVRVYFIARADGSDASSNREKTKSQKEIMNEAFRGSNINFVFEDFMINSDYLWFGEITPYECDISLVGNGL